MELRDNLLLMQDTQSWTEGSAMALCVTPRGGSYPPLSRSQ